EAPVEIQKVRAAVFNAEIRKRRLTAIQPTCVFDYLLAKEPAIEFRFRLPVDDDRRTQDFESFVICRCHIQCARTLNCRAICFKTARSSSRGSIGFPSG